MIELEQYINVFEGKTTKRAGMIMPNDTVLVKEYIGEFGDDFYSKCTVKHLRSRKHRQELVRGYFGDDDKICEDNVRRFVVRLAGIDENRNDVIKGSDITVTYHQSDKDVSSVYPFVKIKFNADVKGYLIEAVHGDIMYAVMTNKKIGKKMFTPEKLGFVSDEKYTNINSIVDVLDSQTENMDNVVLDICKNLIGDVSTVKEEDMCNTIDELMNNKDTYEVKISSIDLDSVSKSTLFNDFGEIIGPCFLLSRLKGDHYVAWPGSSNFPMYDYIIDNTLWISAKHGKGASPSSTLMAKHVQLLTGKGNKKGSSVKVLNTDAAGTDTSNFYVTKIISILADTDRTGKSDSYVIRQIFKLFDLLQSSNIMDDNNELLFTIDNGVLKNAMKVFQKYSNTSNEESSDKNNIYDNKTFLLNEDFIDKHIYKAGKLYDFLTELYTALGYIPSDKYNKSNIVKLWEKNKNVREGCISYPISTAVTDVINKTFAKDISFWACKALEGYQLYIDDSKTSLTITLKAFNTSEYELKSTTSVGNPRNKAISCSIKK